MRWLVFVVAMGASPMRAEDTVGALELQRCLAELVDGVGVGVDDTLPIAAGSRSQRQVSTESPKIEVYPAPTGKGSLPLSDRFAVAVNGRAVDVYQVRVLKPHTWGGDFGPQEYERAGRKPPLHRRAPDRTAGTCAG